MQSLYGRPFILDFDPYSQFRILQCGLSKLRLDATGEKWWDGSRLFSKWRHGSKNKNVSLFFMVLGVSVRLDCYSPCQRSFPKMSNCGTPALKLKASNTTWLLSIGTNST